MRDESRAWYLLALGDQPNDPVSRAAIERLATPGVLAGPPADTLSIRHAEKTNQEPTVPHH
jgi:hypothetical protein